MYALSLSWELACQGHNVRIFARRADPRQREYNVEHSRTAGLSVTRINNTFHRLPGFAQSYLNPEVARRFGEFLDAETPEIVHVHHLMYLSTSCIQEATRRGIPVGMTLHAYWLICQWRRFLKPDLSLCPGQADEGCVRCFAHLLNSRLASVCQRLKPLLGAGSWLKDRLRHIQGQYVASRPPSAQALHQTHQRMTHVREIYREVTLFLAPSQFLRRQFLDSGITPDKIVFSECGLPVQSSPPKRNRKPGSLLTVGYIGVVDAVKGVHLLVEAFQPLTGAELRIYGGEADYVPYPGRGRFLAQLRFSPHIRVMGRYANHEAGRILSEIDVVVVPSIWYENAPLVIREAFLARKPAITAAFGGMQEWVQDGITGLLFQPRDVEGLRRQLERCIANPELIQRLSKHFPVVSLLSKMRVRW